MLKTLPNYLKERDTRDKCSSDITNTISIVAAAAAVVVVVVVVVVVAPAAAIVVVIVVAVSAAAAAVVVGVVAVVVVTVDNLSYFLYLGRDICIVFIFR